MRLLARLWPHRATPVIPPASIVARPAVTPDTVRAALAEVPYPGLARDIVSFGMVRHVAACDGRVRVELALRTSDPAVPDQLRAAIDARLRALGAATVDVAIRPPDALPMPPRAAGRAAEATARDPWAGQVRLRGVQRVVAVGAGKGGVGKSTVAVNLALALAAEGLRVGLLDADIYGPSVPMLLGVADGASRARMTDEKHIVPLEAHGISFVSFGFFLGEGSPAVWRGPMVAKAVKQFATGVAWPELDVLVVDLPPGTGDVPLSLAQALAVDGAVVVTQPARLAAMEGEKAVSLFRALDVRVLGIVENMVGPFGRGAGRDLATALGVPFLGEVPFDAEAVGEGDAGTPTVVARPDGAAGIALARIAQGVAEALGWTRVAASGA